MPTCNNDKVNIQNQDTFTRSIDLFKSPSEKRYELTIICHTSAAKSKIGKGSERRLVSFDKLIKY